MNTVLLQAGGSDFTSFLPIIGMIAIFYFFFIRPQQRKQKETKKYLEEIKKGEMVVTVGGIHGKIMEVSDTTVLIDVDRGTKLLVEKASISLEASKRLNEKGEKKEKK
ncbi:MAG: preprotein translocase subunit YajC [Ekhidna sp.]|uniref:preprotein translocase subunit YajC n=1 Tax=Ekhidna sp. TaxID=2608089 RepID=UPI0032EC5286